MSRLVCFNFPQEKPVTQQCLSQVWPHRPLTDPNQCSKHGANAPSTPFQLAPPLLFMGTAMPNSWDGGQAEARDVQKFLPLAVSSSPLLLCKVLPSAAAPYRAGSSDPMEHGSCSCSTKGKSQGQELWRCEPVVQNEKGAAPRLSLGFWWGRARREGLLQSFSVCVLGRRAGQEVERKT